MADRLAYIKFFFENRIAIISIFVTLSGWNGWQFWEGSNKDLDIVNMKTQITQLAEMVNKPPVKEVKVIKERVIVREGCSQCMKLIKELQEKHR